MAVINLGKFGGEMPIYEEHKLPDEYAAEINNAILVSGAVTPVWGFSVVSGVTISSGVKTIHEVIDDTGASYWLEFKNYTAAAQVPEGKVATQRMVFSSHDHEPRWGDLTSMLAGSGPYPSTLYVLGVFPPASPPTVTATGGTAATESRTYVYTFVTQDGFESAPSPASSVVSAPSDATWSVTVPDLAPPNSGNITAVSSSSGTHTLTLDSVFGLRAHEEVNITLTGMTGKYRIDSVDATAKTITIKDSTATPSGTGTWSRVALHNVTNMKKRLYRGVNNAYSLVTNPDGTAYEVSASVTSMTDDSTKTLGESLPTVTREMAPADIRQIRSMPNGMMVGIRKNEVCFSEIGIFYAWPKEYRYGIEEEAMAVASTGFNAVVATKGRPMVFSGSVPESMTAQQIGESAPCEHPMSIAVLNNAAVYAAPFGLVAVNTSGLQNVTKSIAEDSDWAEFLSQPVVSAVVNGVYYMLYYDKKALDYRLLAFDFKFPTFGFSFFSKTGVSTISSGFSGDKLYVVVGSSLSKFHSDSSKVLPFKWKSKKFILPQPTSLTAFQVRSLQSTVSSSSSQTAQDAQKTANQTAITNKDTDGEFNGASLNKYSMNGSKIIPPSFVTTNESYVTIEIFIEGVSKFTKTVKDSAIHRMPFLGKVDDYQVSITGTVPVYQVILANNPMDIRQV